jgi:hypothetical protein
MPGQYPTYFGLDTFVIPEGLHTPSAFAVLKTVPFTRNVLITKFVRKKILGCL